ncbi:hypothetical protein AD953_01015, partial [Acetobacter malorum]
AEYRGSAHTHSPAAGTAPHYPPATAAGLATAITPQILLMDEWFMAGDFHFRERAEKRLSSVVNNTDILVITSHALDVLEEWCTRLIWMEGGQIRMDGPTAEVMAAYRTDMQVPDDKA